MGRPAIDIELFRDEIEQRFRNNTWTTIQAIVWLRLQCVRIQPVAFKKRLKQWVVAIKPRRNIEEDSEALLKEEIKELFYQWDMGDDDTCQILSIEGYTISLRQYQRFRKSLGLKSRIPGEDQPAYKDILTGVLSSGALDDHENRRLVAVMRRQHGLIGRYRLLVRSWPESLPQP